MTHARENSCSRFLIGLTNVSAVSFEVLANDPQCAARLGRLTTPHGEVETPIFMPVGTQATVKGVTPAMLEDAGARIVLANTYHLALRPGSERVAHFGGLHSFMAWSGPILTDSGGFQVFSLKDLRKIDENGVKFRSHIDGRWLEMTPEESIRIQENLGADIVMCFDECPPADAPVDKIRAAVDRTTAWAARCKAAQTKPDQQALFGIVQGGINASLRQESAQALREIGFPGYAVGGLSVGETPEQMVATLEETCPHLPADKPRYLMGVGRPIDLIEAVYRGIDMFDCVMPTRNGRNASAFTSEGVIKLRNSRFADDNGPLDPKCGCYGCRTFSRGYLRHLFLAEEMLGPILVSLHNIAFYMNLVKEMRQAIRLGRFGEFRASALAVFGESL